MGIILSLDAYSGIGPELDSLIQLDVVNKRLVFGTDSSNFRIGSTSSQKAAAKFQKKVSLPVYLALLLSESLK